VVITKFRDLEKIILTDGWKLKSCVGSHFQYVHPTKPGKVTIPSHTGDIPKGVVSSVLKQARLK
jgi:predicted RNA binding protein YcfA (HicA-like mRNA interferase family)